VLLLEIDQEMLTIKGADLSFVVTDGSQRHQFGSIEGNGQINVAILPGDQIFTIFGTAIDEKLAKDFAMDLLKDLISHRVITEDINDRLNQNNAVMVRTNVIDGDWKPLSKLFTKRVPASEDAGYSYCDLI